MGLLGKLWVKLGLDSSEYKKGINDVDGAIRSFGNRLKTFGQAVGVAFGIGMIGQFGKKIIQTRGEFESLEISFRTLLKSKSAADALMAQMVDLAARTPFSLQQVATGAKQLLAYGFAASEVRGTLSQLGDVAAALGLPMERLTYLYGTTRTQGRLFARDLMQFTTSGIPLLDELAKMFGKSTEEINKMVSAGEIGFEEVKQAFSNMTGESGKFYNLMEERSKGIGGKISNLGDAISVMFNNIGKSQEGPINSALNGAKFLVDNYQEVWKILKTLIYTYGVYKTVLITVAAVQKAKVIWDTVAAFNASTSALKRTTQAQILLNKAVLANPYVLLASAIAAVVGVLVLFGKEAKSTEDIINSLDAATKNFTENKNKISDLATEYEDLKNKTNRTEFENNRLNEVMKLLARTIPEAVSEFDDYGRALDINIAKVKEFGKEQRKNLKIEANSILKDANARLKEIDEELRKYNAITQKGTFQRQKQVFIGGEAITVAETETVSYGEKAIAIAAKEANKLGAEKLKLSESIAQNQKLILEIDEADSDVAKEIAETYRTSSEILADIKTKTAEISKLEAKSEKTVAEINNLEVLRGELKAYEDEYKIFTGKEFGAKVKVETDKDALKDAGEGSVAYLENLLSKKQLALKLVVTDTERANLQREISDLELQIKAKLEVLPPKTERKIVEDRIEALGQQQLEIPVSIGTEEAQYQFDILQYEINELKNVLKNDFPTIPEIVPPEGSIAAFSAALAKLDDDILKSITTQDLLSLNAKKTGLALERDLLQKFVGTGGLVSEEDVFGAYIRSLDALYAKMQDADPVFAAFIAKTKELAIESRKSNEQVSAESQALGSGITDGIQYIADAIAAGENIDFTQLTAALITPLADLLVQQGAMLIATGIGWEALKKIVESGGWQAIAAGAAMIALGVAARAAFSGGLSKATGGGGGGNATNFTGGYSNGSSTSVAAMQLVSPQSQTIVVKGEVSGGQLRFILDKDDMRKRK